MLLLLACVDSVAPPIDSEPALVWYADDDGDGWGDPERVQTVADRPGGWVATPGDCDDHAPAVHPEAAETCDGLDDDCDGAIDEDAVDLHRYYDDDDHDGYGDTPVLACALGPGMSEVAGDCDDTTADAHPGAAETCAPGDEDCDGAEAWCRRSAPFLLDEAGHAFHTDQGERLGWALDAADVDGDGVTDFALSAPYHDDEGAVFVFRGPITRDVTTEDAWLTFTSPGDGPYLGDRFSLDDLDGDGDLDLVTSCRYGETHEDSHEGNVLVAWGPFTEGTWDFGLALVGAPDDWLGWSIANLGDTDGDGLPEVLVRTSERLVLLGGFTGTGDVDARDFTRGTFSTTDDDFGSELTALGDLDGDGLADVAIGAEDAETDAGLMGRISIFYGPLVGDLTAADAGTVIEPTRGHANLVRAKVVGDLDGDGATDVAVEAQGRTEGGSWSGSVVLWTGPLGATPDLEAAFGYFAGEAVGDKASEVAGDGDLDGDGYGDLAIAAPGHGDDGGRLYLAYGPFTPGATDLASLPARADGNPEARLGDEDALRLVPGDDGVDRVLIGAPYDQAGADWLGSAWLL